MWTTQSCLGKSRTSLSRGTFDAAACRDRRSPHSFGYDRCSLCDKQQRKLNEKKKHLTKFKITRNKLRLYFFGLHELVRRTNDDHFLDRFRLAVATIAFHTRFRRMQSLRMRQCDDFLFRSRPIDRKPATRCVAVFQFVALEFYRILFPRLANVHWTRWSCSLTKLRAQYQHSQIILINRYVNRFVSITRSARLK